MTARERIENAGFDNIVIFEDYSYDSALIGVSTDDRAVYSYEKMVEWLMREEECSYTEAVEWIDYNTIRALPYLGNDAPIIVYDLEE